MKRISIGIVLMITFMLMSSVVASAARIELGGSNSSVDKISGRDAKIAWQISHAYQMTVTAEQINYLHGQDFGYGEIGLIYAFINSTNKSIGEITDLRLQEKQGWGQIAQRLGANLEEAASGTVEVLRKAKMDDEIKIMNDLLETEERAAKDKKIIVPSKKKEANEAARLGNNGKPTYHYSGKSTF